MSTQAAESIRFTHTFPQQGFRLLELPSELLDLLSSENPPTYETNYTYFQKGALLTDLGLFLPVSS